MGHLRMDFVHFEEYAQTRSALENTLAVSQSLQPSQSPKRGNHRQVHLNRLQWRAQNALHMSLFSQSFGSPDWIVSYPYI